MPTVSRHVFELHSWLNPIGELGLDAFVFPKTVPEISSDLLKGESFNQSE
jgi:hypothetical protein